MMRLRAAQPHHHHPRGFSLILVCFRCFSWLSWLSWFSWLKLRDSHCLLSHSGGREGCRGPLLRGLPENLTAIHVEPEFGSLVLFVSLAVKLIGSRFL